jgi:prepilin peptidase CpaA
MGLNEVALGLTLSIAAYTDWREHRIYNKLLGPAFLFAIIFHAASGGIAGIKLSLLGTLLGFSLLLIPYFLGGMGAGDVKLLAVIGAFGGADFVFTSFLYGAVIGGIISGALLVRRKALGVTLKRLLLIFPLLAEPQFLKEDMREARQEKFPYGIAIVLGTLLAFILPIGGRLV